MSNTMAHTDSEQPGREIELYSIPRPLSEVDDSELHVYCTIDRSSISTKSLRAQALRKRLILGVIIGLCVSLAVTIPIIVIITLSKEGTSMSGVQECKAFIVNNL